MPGRTNSLTNIEPQFREANTRRSSRHSQVPSLAFPKSNRLNARFDRMLATVCAAHGDVSNVPSRRATHRARSSSSVSGSSSAASLDIGDGTLDACSDFTSVTTPTSNISSASHRQFLAKPSHQTKTNNAQDAYNDTCVPAWMKKSLTKLDATHPLRSFLPTLPVSPMQQRLLGIPPVEAEDRTIFSFHPPPAMPSPQLQNFLIGTPHAAPRQFLGESTAVGVAHIPPNTRPFAIPGPKSILSIVPHAQPSTPSTSREAQGTTQRSILLDFAPDFDIPNVSFLPSSNFALAHHINVLPQDVLGNHPNRDHQDGQVATDLLRDRPYPGLSVPYSTPRPSHRIADSLDPTSVAPMLNDSSLMRFHYLDNWDLLGLNPEPDLDMIDFKWEKFERSGPTDYSDPSSDGIGPFEVDPVAWGIDENQGEHSFHIPPVIVGSTPDPQPSPEPMKFMPTAYRTPSPQLASFHVIAADKVREHDGSDASRSPNNSITSSTS